MRIWYQSSTTVGKDPSYREYEDSLKRHIREVARPDSVVDIHGVEVLAPGTDRCRYFRVLNNQQIINNAIRAEREGYDAFAVGCLADPGFPEILQIVDIPVVFALQSSLHLACQLSPNFSVLHFGKMALLGMEERIKNYGLKERYIPGSFLKLDMDTFHQGLKRPELVMDSIREEAREIAGRGTNMLVPGCIILNMILVQQGLREIEGVPVLDACGALVKTAELMVDLKGFGVTRSKYGLYSPVTKEELARARQLYGVE